MKPQGILLEIENIAPSALERLALGYKKWGYAHTSREAWYYSFMILSHSGQHVGGMEQTMLKEFA